MAWIRTISDEEATGDLAKIYEEARRRAGRVYNIVRISSLRPAVLEKSLDLYQTLMLGPSSLSRTDREMLATAVSTMNHCHY
ncbi:MAG: carboxymuconolactone decarboxylase family protein [Planctomycetes bacterium]|nr:carboxymuconolactone decarboxylase family protein [Planctomycetota bacterium]